MIKEYINKIVENGTEEEMQELAEILEELMWKLKETDEKCYKKYKMQMYELAYGKKLTEEMAHNIVESMEPYGEHWTIEQTTSVKNQYGYSNIDDIDFYVVLNSLVNDYNKVIPQDNVEMYAKMANAFINDEDAEEGKVYTYFTTIV